MCVVSMILDHYYDKWRPYQPSQPPAPWVVPAPWQQPGLPGTFPSEPLHPVPHVPVPTKTLPTPEEIAEFHELLRKAREYDKRNNEQPCESEDKKRRVQELADALGIKISFE